MAAKEARDAESSSGLIRTLTHLCAWVAVLSSLYHITAIYLTPLPGEMHPNMHLLFAYFIILIGGAAAKEEIFGDRFKGMGLVASLYVAAVVLGVFAFYGIYEFNARKVWGTAWTDASIWWAYALPFVCWAAMFVHERAWKALALWALSFVPALLMFANWNALPTSVQAQSNWWLIAASAVPTGWMLFLAFHRPAEGVRKAALALAVAAATALLAAWRVGLWAHQPDSVRDVLYLWPLLVLLIPAIWAKRRAREVFEDFPCDPLPRSIEVGINVGLLALSAGACLYIFYEYNDLTWRVGAPVITDIRAGFIMIAVGLELTRRSFGTPLPILALIAVLYGLWGNLFESPFGHAGAGWIELTGKLSTDFIGGVFGFLVIISATFIIMFLILGTFLHESGAGQFFVNFALGLFGRLRAGAGLAAVGSSALMGTVSGSAAGNVVTTGTFTIPLMKRIGLSPHIAAAAEAAASSGGQIMPPVMGAGAFIMSELIDVPYIRLIGYATIPAVLYFLIVGINIQFAAGRLNLQPLPPEQIPDWRSELRRGWFYLVPLILLVYFLIGGHTPTFSGVMAIFAMVLVWFYRCAAEFLARMRLGDRFVSDEGYAFVPISFWSYAAVVYAVLYAGEAWLGWNFRLGLPVTPANVAVAAAALGVTGVGLGALLLRFMPNGGSFWYEVERGWVSIYPLCVVLLWLMFGWNAGLAGLCIVLALLGLWSAVHGVGVRPFAAVPWLFISVWLASYGAVKALYWVFPAVEKLADYVVPFGFFYHALIFFAFAVVIQQVVFRLGAARQAGDASPTRVSEVVGIACNPMTYLFRARRSGRAGPDVQAAQGAVRWLDAVRRALMAGGKQGAEFGVTLLTIQIVVEVLTFSGVGNKFAYLIESLSRDVCLLGVAAGGGCIGFLGFDGFFVALALTAVACAILGMGMPTTAAYVLLAILGGPVLVKLIGPALAPVYGPEWMEWFISVHGDRVAAHMFIFYFAILSAITPPVAIASLVAAKMAGASYLRTSMTALRFAIVGFIVPFLFMYEPSLLALDDPSRVAVVAAMTLIAFTAFSAATQGWLLSRLFAYERALLFASFICLVFFDIYFYSPLLILGVILAAHPLIRQVRLWRLERAAARA